MSNDTTDAAAPARQGADTTAARRKPWSSPMLRHVGRIGDVLQGGGGKLSPVIEDSGDTRKPPGQA